MTPPPGNGWSEYEKLVLYRLDIIEARLGNIESRLAINEQNTTANKVKMGGIYTILALVVSIIVGVVI